VVCCNREPILVGSIAHTRGLRCFKQIAWPQSELGRIADPFDRGSRPRCRIAH
jgi:hypothetical protein